MTPSAAGPGLQGLWSQICLAVQFPLGLHSSGEGNVQVLISHSEKTLSQIKTFELKVLSIIKRHERINEENCITCPSQNLFIAYDAFELTLQFY